MRAAPAAAVGWSICARRNEGLRLASRLSEVSSLMGRSDDLSCLVVTFRLFTVRTFVCKVRRDATPIYLFSFTISIGSHDAPDMLPCAAARGDRVEPRQGPPHCRTRSVDEKSNADTLNVSPPLIHDVLTDTQFARTERRLSEQLS